MPHPSYPVGFDVLQNPRLNKSTAFTAEEIENYKLRGLIPPAICSQEAQIQRVMENLHRKNSDIERYIFLQALLARNERLFYRTVVDHIEEIMPLIYTPTVGQACKEYAHIFRQPRGDAVRQSERRSKPGIFRRRLGRQPDRAVRPPPGFPKLRNWWSSFTLVSIQWNRQKMGSAGVVVGGVKSPNLHILLCCLPW